MIQIEEAIIRELIFHTVNLSGAKAPHSNVGYYYKDDDAENLKKIFLKPFTTNITTYEFKHDLNLELNPLFSVAKSIHEGSNFISKSKDICQHLTSVSKHPNIKNGDLFVLKVDDVLYNNKYYEALGIFKVETKEKFIETSQYQRGETGIDIRQGIGARRLDKACLILFTEQPYTIFVIDNANTQTDYWQNEFINLRMKNDHVNNTSQFLNIAKSFATQQFPAQFEVNKADQVDLLNRSVEYFKSHDHFEKKRFEQEVLQDREIIKSFRNFDSSYRQENDVKISDTFEISAQAVKKQTRIFKSVLKLDKNFHIYIHGDRELIEQGTEKDGRKYYKIYFQQES